MQKIKHQTQSFKDTFKCTWDNELPSCRYSADDAKPRSLSGWSDPPGDFDILGIVFFFTPTKSYKAVFGIAFSEHLVFLRLFHHILLDCILINYCIWYYPSRIHTATTATAQHWVNLLFCRVFDQLKFFGGQGRDTPKQLQKIKAEETTADFNQLYEWW